MQGGVVVFVKLLQGHNSQFWKKVLCISRAVFALLKKGRKLESQSALPRKVAEAQNHDSELFPEDHYDSDRFFFLAGSGF